MHYKRVNFMVCGLYLNKHVFKMSSEDFPGGSVVKNLPANAGDTALIPDQRRSHMPPMEQLNR